jgi:glycosyltransferase involved in cell wall biosynthesis
MRILHVIPYMHPSAGGPPVVVEHLTREASKLGHLSEIISTPLFCVGDERVLLQRLNELAPTTFLSRFWPIDLLSKLHRRQLVQSICAADIVHIHTLWNPLNTIVRQECVRRQRPYVLMPHGMLDPYSLSVRRWRKALYLWGIEARNILTAHRIIYTSAEEARLATTKLTSLPKGVVIPLGGDAPAESSALLMSHFIECFPIARDRRRLLFLGRVHFKKGLDRILTVLPAIVRQYPDVLLMIVGDGTSAFEASVKRTITTKALENNVIMTGRLEGRTKWGAFASADLFLLPSRQENFAIAMAEAMHMGVPVIVSDRVNAWPYVRESGAGLVLDEKGIEIRLKEALLSLLADPRRIEKMSKAGQEYARKNLNWRSSVSRMLTCYEDVLAVNAIIPSSQITLDRIDALLNSMSCAQMRQWTIEQDIFSMIAQGRFDPLPSRYAVEPVTAGAYGQLTSCHFIGVCRHRFYQQGIKKLREVGFLDRLRN